MNAILHDQGDQTVFHTPRSPDGRVHYVSSATYRIIDTRYGEDDGNHEVATGTATPGSFSTTTDAAAGPLQSDPKLVPVAATTNAATGRTVLLEESDGQREALVIEKIASGVSVSARGELRKNYTSGATVRDVELQVTFPSAEAADDTVLGGDYIITFEYTLEGQKILATERREIGRYTSGSPITVQDVVDFWPGLERQASDNLERAVRAAWREAQAKLVRAGDALPQRVLQSEHIKVALVKGALHWALRWTKKDDLREQADEFKTEFYQDLHVYTAGVDPRGDLQVDLGEASRKTKRRGMSPIKPW